MSNWVLAHGRHDKINVTVHKRDRRESRPGTKCHETKSKQYMYV